ncbi:MAG: endoribonuclease MazF [Candidatus Acidiferrum sp.]|jgi:mRNA interferase MazF
MTRRISANLLAKRRCNGAALCARRWGHSLDQLRPTDWNEQAGHRPAVVLSPAAYNAKTSLMVCCPMTTQIKNYPFEVVIAGSSPSAILADQVKSLHWRKRRAKRKGIISVAELAEVRAKVRALIG